jgi:hypothetical protein
MDRIKKRVRDAGVPECAEWGLFGVLGGEVDPAVSVQVR